MTRQAKLPEERTRTVYEWVVEQVEGPVGDREIIECWYFDENDLRSAEATARQVMEEGAEYDFGLCRRVGSDCESETDRGYAYLTAEGWPEGFDNGESIPARFLPIFERLAS